MTDLRFAFRSLRRTPGLGIAVVLTLALGLGANTTMFGVLDTLLLKPPAHVQDPGRVERLYLRKDFGPVTSEDGVGAGCIIENGMRIA